MSILKKFNDSFLNLKITHKFFFVVVFFVIGVAAIVYAHTLINNADDYTFYAIVAAVLFINILVLWLVVVNGVLKPISALQAVMNAIAAGDLDARVKSASQDEIGDLANAFDALRDNQVSSSTNVSAVSKTESEYQQLNTSLITLLRSVSVLTQKDLTVKMPVAKDMTGSISNTINLLIGEMSATLKEVTHISARMNLIASKVKEQSSHEVLLADHQGKEIEATIEKLNTAVNTMTKIAQYSQLTHKESEKTMLSTESAGEAVAKVSASINGVQEIIRETEKKLTRLAECSQEITQAVNTINNIAERTQILSVNAGMQAASAGETGKVFMVIANEVQRLAENAQGATEKVSSLVTNIQIDAADTMKTMNTVMSQVINGAHQAAEADKRITESRATTESLAAAVKKIAISTLAQLTVGKNLKDHATNIQASTLKSHQQLQQHRQLSDALAKDAHELSIKVNVFKLPK